MFEDTYGLSAHMSRVPWRTGYQLGSGIDVVTGASAQRAVKPFLLKTTPGTPAALQTRILLCESEHAVRDAVSFTTSAGSSSPLNVVPLNLHAVLGGAFETLRCIRKSSTSFSLLVLSRKLWLDQVGIDVELNSDAAAHASHSPASFRDTYGDYFIAGMTTEALFTAVLTWTCVDQESRKLVESHVQAALNVSPLTFDARIGKVLDKLAKDKHVRVSIQIGMRGTDSKVAGFRGHAGDLTQVSQVFEPFEWFQQHAVGEAMSALLCPYYSLAAAANVPRSLPVPDLVFGQLSRIRDMLFDCQFRVANLPPSLVSSGPLEILHDTCVSLANRCDDYYQTRLPYDDDLRARLLDDLRSLRLKLLEFEHIHEFFRTVLQKPKQELMGDLLSAREGKIWRFGCLSPSAAGNTPFVSVYKSQTEIRQVLGLLRPGSRTECITITPQSGEHIVGWTVTARRSSGRWRKVSPQIILSREATIKLRRGFRTNTWEFTAYAIRNTFFDMLCQHEASVDESTLDTYEAIHNNGRVSKGRKWGYWRS